MPGGIAGRLLERAYTSGAATVLVSLLLQQGVCTKQLYREAPSEHETALRILPRQYLRLQMRATQFKVATHPLAHRQEMSSCSDVVYRLLKNQLPTLPQKLIVVQKPLSIV
jgi:hypothetical protein